MRYFGSVGLGCCVGLFGGFDDFVEVVEHGLVAALTNGIRADSERDVKGREVMIK